MSHISDIFAGLANFASETRLYELIVSEQSGLAAHDNLLVEAFVADERMQQVGYRDVIALSLNAHIEPSILIGKPAQFLASLADGTRASFRGYISAVAVLGSDGGFARYRLRLSPWLWQLGEVRNSRAWENCNVREIIDSVFAPYLPLARWRWSDDVDTFLTDAGSRDYCCQYRESDLDFVTRLLTEEGLGWYFEDVEEDHCMVLFSDSVDRAAIAEDTSSASKGGIRFHAARSSEESDAILAISNTRRLIPSESAMLSYDYKSKKIVKASVATTQSSRKALPMLEHYEAPGHCAFAHAGQAEHYAMLHAEALEVAGATWSMRSTVRSLRPGKRFALVDSPLASSANGAAYVAIRVFSIGINNLPSDTRDAVAEILGAIPELLEELLPDDVPEFVDAVLTQARATGYANCLDAIAAAVPWRPAFIDRHGALRSHPRPVAYGSQTALVVGANGDTSANGADELYCDALGRVRIRFHWQDENASCWVRVAQRSAGGGMGSQFLPRIGQEVLVQFLENDIDRPIIVGALYNGRGEGGVVPTPGGRTGDDDSMDCFAPAHDHATSGQGNLASGNSPVWHGASADSNGHRNGAAQWGVRTKEFGGTGYNQLVFDDTDAQGRIQLKSSHAASELNLGHLIHSADNYRGSLRGQGVELRTDAYGAVRGGRWVAGVELPNDARGART